MPAFKALYGGIRSPRRNHSLSADGFSRRFDVGDYDAAVRRAFALYGRRAEWKKVQAQAMAQQFDWETAADHYVAVYGSMAG